MKTSRENSSRPAFIFFLLLQLAAIFELPAQTVIVFSDDFNAGALDANKWLKGTNAGNQAVVSNGVLQLNSQSGASAWLVTKNKYTARNTTVAVKFVQSGNDNNLGCSPTSNLSSPYGIFNEANWYRFYVYRSGSTGPFRLYVQWKKNNVEGGADVTGSLTIASTVYLRLRFDNTNIHFEASLDGLAWTDTYTEVFGLPGYTLDSSFHYELAAYSTPSKGAATFDDFVLTNTNVIPDTQPPTISSVAATNVTTSAATINWNTNEASDSQVEYGLTTSYGASTSLNTALLTSHSVALTGLQSNTLYHYRVKSGDAAGNLAIGGDFTFTTTSFAVQFVDITASAGVAGIPDHGGHAILFADVNADELLDMYVTHTNFAPSPGSWVPGYDAQGLANFLVLPDELFINNGNNTFTESAAAAGVNDPGESHGAVFVDFDHDGDYDLFNGQRGPSGNRLYKNNGNGTFSEVTAAAGILPADRRTIGALALDIENDGDMDLFSANWGVGNEMYVNDGAGHFTVENRGVTDIDPDPNGTMSATAADVDNDGDMDIFMAKRIDVPGDACKLYINNGAGYFTDQAASRGVAFVGHANGAIFVDIDWDGDLDLLLAASGIDRANPIIKLGIYRNQGNGTFVDETNVHNIPFDGYTLNAGDLDNDGDTDIFTYINSGTGQIWLNNGAGFFTAQTNAGFSHVGADVRAAALADTDNDGDLDVAFTEINAPTSFYRNVLINGAPAQNYLQIELTGADGRAGMFGSKFYLYEAGHLDDPAYLRGYQQLTSVVGTLAQNSPIVHFGVAPAKTYDLRVKMLDGNSVVRTNITPGQRLNLQAPPDVTPPVISSVTATSVTTSAATINWNTNEASDSQVEYGLTTSYGASTPLNTTLLTNHSVSLSNLQANTLYHYRVKSKDAAGNLATSADFTFTTLVPDVTPPVISSVTATGITPSSATINWSTNEASDTQVEYGLTTSYGASTALDATLITSHTVALSGLQQNTTYHYRVKSKDAVGNLATSADFTFTTLVLQVLDVTLQAETMPVKTNGDVRPPGWVLFEDGYVAANVNFPVTGTYDFTLRAFGKLVAGEWSKAEIRIDQVAKATITVNSASYADFAASFTVAAGTHQVAVAFINDLYAPPDDRNLYIDWLRVKSNTPADTQPPVISSVTATNVTTSSATITWSTDEASDTQVEYGLTTSYGASTPLNTTLLTNHAVSLTSLQANTLYHYRVKSKDAAGNLATSADFTFTTNAIVDVTPPVISSVAATNVTTSAATINWSTNEASDSQVEYGLTTSYGASTPLDAALIMSHTIAFSGLQQNTTYHYRVKSKDAAGNLATSADFTFTTLANLNAITLYTPFEVSLSTATVYGNPYSDISVTGVFTAPSGRVLPLKGFWNGGQNWLVRFSPDETGLWQYQTQSVDPELVKAGTFAAVANPAKRGFVRVSAARPYQFEYSDGTPFLLMGDTNWDGMSSGVGLETRFKPYINLRASQNFNAYHTIVVHSRYDYQANEGGVPFAMIDETTRNYDSLNPGFFQWVDKRVAYADSMGVTSILFVSWAYEIAKMTTAQYDRLTQYLVARYAAYNVFWVLAGDYQSSSVTAATYRQIGQAVANADPYDHPLTIHPSDGFSNREFANDAWLSYLMHQIRDAGEFIADSIRVDRVYHKPVVNGEYGYHQPFTVFPGHGILADANYTRTGGWSLFGAGGYFIAGFLHTFLDPDGHYPYDPGFDVLPTYWDLNDPLDLEAARQYSVFHQFFRNNTAWQNLAPHPEWVLDDQTELLATPGVEYVAYHARGGRMRLQLPAGYFSLAWFDPIAGALQPARVFQSTGESVLMTPVDTLDAAALIRPATAPALTYQGNVTNLQSTQLNIKQMRFTWQTPVAADSRIDLQRPDGSRVQFVDHRETTAHALVVDGLAANVNYTVTVSSQTANGLEWRNAPQNLTTVVQVMDTWSEAEDMPVKTAGQTEAPGWNLNANGYLATTLTFPQSGSYAFTLRARGECRQSIWPNLTLELDGAPLASWTINSAIYKEFVFSGPVGAGAHEVKIVFTNADNDRQLVVDYLHTQFNDLTDTQPPVISNVAVNNISTSAATISWSTDEASDSQVEYGLTTNYGASTSLSTTLLTNHTVALTGLQANTLYHYRVKSRDAAGNLATSGDFIFTTAAAGDVTAPVISGVAASNISTSTATISWSTNEASDSQVEYGLTTNYGASTSLSPTLLTNHAVSLSNLQPNTLYHYRVKSKDAAGNLATSGDFTFTTAAAPQNFDVTLQAESMPIKTNGDARPPGWVLFEDGYLAQNVNFPGSGLHQFTLRASGKYAAGEWSQAELRIDQTARAVISVNATSYTDFTVEFMVTAGTHEVAVAFINDYYAPPADRNLYVDWLRIQGDGTNPTDTQPPVITGVVANGVAATSATIIWTTDEASDSQVEYGLTTSYGASTPLSPALLTNHAVALAGLQANTLYHYRVKSKDAAGNLATSGDFTLTTPPLSTAGSVAFANVQDLFSGNCVRCHQGATAPGGLALLPGQAYGNIVNVPSTEYPQWQRVQPGSRATSWLYEKISSSTPPVGSKMGELTPDELELIGTWIDQGATETPVPPYANLQFRTATLGNGEINIAYFASIVAWGGLPPYQFNVISGTLPHGLVLDPSSGMLVGTPNTVGSYDFTVRVSDSQAPAATLDRNYHIEIFNTSDHWQLPAGFVIENVVSDLHLPVNIAFVPNPGPNPTDPYFYVTLLYGDIIMVQRNFQKQTYATGLLNFVPTGVFPGSGEMGVTGIAVDPASGDVFASMVYEEIPGSEDFRGKVVRFHSTDGGRTAATQTTILSGFPSAISHQIQEVTIGADGKVYVNTGDGWVSEAAPDINDKRGKVLRMNLDGSVPEDNPFPGNITFATGFRNPFGAAWRQADGKLYVSDNGQDIDDRVAKVNAGDDYGWGLLSQDLTKGAIFLWNPTVAPVAMDFLQNNSFPSRYYGNLFVGLSGPPYWFGPTPRGKKIQRFVLDPNGQVVSDSVFLDYTGAGAATVIGVAFGEDGLYFTDLYGENGFDQFGQTHGNIYRIRSTAAVDTTRPAISNVQTTNITGTSATVVWQTNEAATRQVEYGLTTSYGASTPLSTTLATTHSVTLSQLTPETTYHFRVLSADAANNSSVSDDFTFTTLAVDNTPPVISAVQVDSITVTGAVVKWTTNEPAASFVDFGLTNAYGTTVSNAALATSHRLVLSGLADSTLYHFRVRSLDASGNAAASPDGQFTTRHLVNTTLDVTLEAENMPIKTNGDARPPGWALFENGYIAENVSFPAAGVYQFTLRARGMEANGEWSMAELWIDQVPRVTLNIDNGNYTDFMASFTVPAGAHEVAIAFVNDIYAPPLNRNLYVDWLRIQNNSTGHGAVKAAAAASTPSAPPEQFILQNFPNPFNAATRIRFALPRAAEVEVKIFDVAGRELNELANGERAAGHHEVIWNGRRRNGEELSSGVYLVRLRYRTERQGAWSQLLQRVLLVK